MNKIYAVIIMFFALLSGCASIPLEPHAERIIVSPKAAPKGCKYLGQVIGNQGNFFTGGWTSNRNLEEGAMNDLKNQAHKLGANYVHLISNRAGNTGSFNSMNGSGGGGMAQTNVTDLGNAYVCKPAAIGLE